VRFFLGYGTLCSPGHGKTWLAAASVRGSRSGRQGASLLFGWVLSHFAVILLLALLAQVLDSEALLSFSIGLKQLAGLLIAAPAAHRLGIQLRRIRTNDRVTDSKANTQDEHDRSIPQVNGLSAGLTAGLVPCWEAVGLLLLGLSAGHPAQGLRLVAAFIAGGVVVVVTAISFAGILVPKFRIGDSWGTLSL
jgi:nickel/cobalt transporter (NicO) family protein